VKRLRRKNRETYPEQDERAIDIIPLIDVMFLLLCFFIFLTLAMVFQEGINVDLAQAQEGASVQEQEPVVVSIDEAGKLFLNKEQVSEDNLVSMLKQRAEQNPDRPVFINADENARHKRVIFAMDSIQKAGLSNVTFTVRPQ